MSNKPACRCLHIVHILLTPKNSLALSHFYISLFFLTLLKFAQNSLCSYSDFTIWSVNRHSICGVKRRLEYQSNIILTYLLHITEHLTSCLTGLDSAVCYAEIICRFTCLVKSQPVKQEVSCTVTILCSSRISSLTYKSNFGV